MSRIAEILTVPIGTVMSRLSRGRQKLQWFGHKVSMLCFTQDNKQDKNANEDHDVWPAHGLIAASWTRGEKVYLLATRGAQAELERLL